MLTSANENRYYVPVLENSSAGFRTPMLHGGHTASRHQSRRFFCVRCMAVPMSESCGEPQGSPVPCIRSSNLHGSLAPFERGGRETKPLTRRKVMSAVSALSAIDRQEEIRKIKETDLHKVQDAYWALCGTPSTPNILNTHGISPRGYAAVANIAFIASRLPIVSAVRNLTGKSGNSTRRGLRRK
jgi:hypothetical protein